MPLNERQREWLRQYLEPIDDVADPVVDLVELGDNQLTFWEAYFWGRAACHLHLRIGRRGQRGTYNLCADFKVFRGLHEIEFDAFEGTFFELKEAGGYQYGGYHPVFVMVREESEGGKCVPLRVASSVRLQALDDCPMRGAYVLEGVGFRKLFRDDILVGFDNYRKSGSPRSAAREFSSLAFHERELPHEVVEHASQIMHGVPDEQGQPDSLQLGSVGNPEEIVTRLRVELTGESDEVRWVHEEAGADFFIEDVAMLPRPCKLGSAPTEVGSVGHDR